MLVGAGARLRIPGFGKPVITTVSRLMAIYAMVTVAALGIVVFQVVRTYAAHAKKVYITDLGVEVPEYSRAANLRPAGQNLFAFTQSYLSSHVTAGRHILLIEIFGHTVLGSANSSKVIGIPDVESYISNPPRSTRFVTASYHSQPYLVMGSPIVINGNTVGAFVGVTSLSELDRQTSQMMVFAALEALLALVFSVAAGYFLLRRMMSTVGRVTETAVQISRGDLDKRLDYVGQSDEVGRLAMAFDEMILRISQTLDSQRRLLADVSHQLKTPLTVIRGNLELLTRNANLDSSELNETIGVVIGETDYMTTLIEGLLLLERMKEPSSLNETESDLRSFLSDVFTGAIVLGRRVWHLGDIPDVMLFADSAKLKGALLNLLDNAQKATEEDDVISLDAGLSGKWLDISVSDTGRGIDPAYLDTIFERFERAGSADQRGAGLGLAIVKAVADAHGGTVIVESTLGTGTTFTVRLPSNRVLSHIGSRGNREYSDR